jgi:hypothetical protein
VSDLTLQVLKGQQDRDNKVRDLLSTIVDMLGFAEDVEGLQKMQKVQDTVLYMIKEIRDCALFVHEYCGKGLFGAHYGSSVQWTGGLTTELPRTSHTRRCFDYDG